MATHVDITAFIRSLQEEYYPAAMECAAEGAYEFAAAVMGEAQKLCPVSPSNEYMPGVRKAEIKNPRWTGHSGFLANSGVVEEPVIEGHNVRVEMGFNTDYAAAVHEILTARHTHGQAKYLETPLKAMAPQMPEFVLKKLKARFGS